MSTSDVIALPRPIHGQGAPHSAMLAGGAWGTYVPELVAVAMYRDDGDRGYVFLCFDRAGSVLLRIPEREFVATGVDSSTTSIELRGQIR